MKIVSSGLGRWARFSSVGRRPTSPGEFKTQAAGRLNLAGSNASNKVRAKGKSYRMFVKVEVEVGGGGEANPRLPGRRPTPGNP